MHFVWVSDVNEPLSEFKFGLLAQGFKVKTICRYGILMLGDYKEYSDPLLNSIMARELRKTTTLANAKLPKNVE